MKAVIVQPFIESDERTRKLEKEASDYLSSIGYERMEFSSKELADIMMKSSPETDFNAYPFMIGMMCILAAMSGTVCFWEGWQDSSYCQDIHNIAFRYGLNIIYKPSKE